MFERQKESSAMGFRHVSRPLKPGESLPRLPSLMEQVLACRFELSSPESESIPEDDLDEDEAWDDDPHFDA